MHQVVHGDLESNRQELNDLNNVDKTRNGESDEQPSTEVAKFYKLLDVLNEKLYDGSKHSRLYFCIRLFHLKCMCGIPEKALD